MASDKEENSSKRGFAGLSSMVSDVEAAVETANQTNAGHTAEGPTLHTQAAESPQAKAASGRANTPPSQRTSGSSAGKWVLGIAAVLGVFWLVSMNSGTNHTPATSATSNVSPSAPTTTASTSRGWSQQAAPSPPATPTEERPPIGTNNALSAAQIRYCLSEDIRLSAGKAVVNQYLDTEVDRYNALVSDYNSRCGQFRYRRGALESARAEVEARRATLEAEGVARFRGSTSLRPDQPRLADRSQGTAPGRASNATNKAVEQGTVPTYQRADTSVARPSTSTSPQSASVAMGDLSDPERQSIEAACSTDKYLNGPAAYNTCLKRQLAALSPQNRRPDLSHLQGEERQSIEAACSSDKYLNGPAAYNACLRRQLASLSPQNRRPDLSGLSSEERQSIESACSSDKYLNGPAPYNACLRRQLAALGSANRRPDLSGLTNENRRSIEMACSTDKYINGPAAYNACVAQQLARLGR